jgi:hypothetical protein
MSKAKVKYHLHNAKDFWNHAVTNANRNIEKARNRIKQLELAREVFKKNAKEDVPIPGSGAVDSDSATQN